MSEQDIDGRRARTTRGRQLAIEAIVAALTDDQTIEGMSHIAELAGVSERTLFRYFGNQDAMFMAVAQHLAPSTLPYLAATPPDGSFESRVLELAKLRCRFALKFGAMGRTVDRFVNKFEYARQLRANRDDVVKKQTVTWLSPEILTLAKPSVAVINEMLDFEFVDSMNKKFGRRAPQVIADHVLVIARGSNS